MPVIRVRVDPDLFSREFTTPVELGRQNDAGEELYSARPLGSGRWRAVIARLDEDTLSRRHALIEPLDGNRFRLSNLSAKVPIRLLDGNEIAAGTTRELSLPAVLYIGRKQVRVDTQGKKESILRSLPGVMPPHADLTLTASRFPSLSAANSVELENLLRWLQTTMEVLQSAASSSEFFFKAARAVVDIVGLDSGRVLKLEHGVWTPVAVQTASDVEIKLDWKPSQNVLNQLCQEKRTFWQAPDQTDDMPPESLMGVDVVVAAPILDRSGEVIGALYGECRADSLMRRTTRVTKLEAMLVELLAGSVATGLARIEQEKVAVEADVRFKQFFTPELSRQLAANPDLLKGRDSEVSLLFVDIRGFSRISERLGPGGTVDWIGDVMGSLSDCVLDHRGVLVDYIGDELLAMWGAPEEQADHARLACLAAIDMFNLLPKLNERWQEKLGEAMSLGIGVNTGIARVGNTGSRHKFKYGPLGNTVNLASRVQGATKYLRCRLLITEFTKSKLDDSFFARRLCRVRVVNIEKPVNLYELSPQGLSDWVELKTAYEDALLHFEQKRFRDACRRLGGVMASHPNDGPALILMARAINLLVEEPFEFDPVWELPGK